MHDNAIKSDLDAPAVDDMYTDTSMFNAEDIVKNIESVAAARQEAQEERELDARRRAEILREQKMLEQDLEDLDSFDID